MMKAGRGRGCVFNNRDHAPRLFAASLSSNIAPRTELPSEITESRRVSICIFLYSTGVRPIKSVEWNIQSTVGEGHFEAEQGRERGSGTVAVDG